MVRKMRLISRRRLGKDTHRRRCVARNLERAIYFQYDERDSAQDRD
jgi:hypothetical protein